MIEQRLPPETYVLLVDLLRQTIGARVEVVNSQIVNQHHDYYALLVTTQNPSYKLAVKIAGREAPYLYPFNKTAALHQLVAAQTSIPMPDVIAVDVSYRAYPWRYLINTFIPGQEWATVQNQLDERERVDAYQQMGAAIAELHQIQFDHFGDVNRGSADISYLSALTERVHPIVREEHYRDEFLRLLDSNRDLFSSVIQPRLCHEDLHHYNILFRQDGGRWKLATILDFDKAWAGHYEIDLAKLDMWQNMTSDDFWRAYRQSMTIAPDYPLRRPIYQLLWCLDYAANTPQHLADTQKLCRELDFPAIERFE